jgi:hypothetical protein
VLVREIAEDAIIPNGVSVCIGPTYHTYRFQYEGKRITVDFPIEKKNLDGEVNDLGVMETDLPSPQ